MSPTSVTAADAKLFQDELVTLRRALHREPELGLDLPRTQEKVLAALDGLPLEITTGAALTSVTAVLRGGRRDEAAPKAALLRGDMDALPVTERTGRDFSSQVAGRMHACGHDLHTAILVGAAKVLSEHRDALAGDVVFMFQPGEEGMDGAGHMIGEGVLEAAGAPIVGAYGLHVTSWLLPAGVFASRAGTLMASADEIKITVRGAGAHGSTPFRGRDPIPAAAEMVVALQSAVTRRFDIFDPVVATVGTFHAGTKANIIPDDAVFEVTLRAFSVEAREKLQNTVGDVVRGVAAAHGLDVELDFNEQYPPTVNHDSHVDFLEETVGEIYGASRFVRMQNPLPGAEDFSRVLAAVPGAYGFLGATVGDPDSSASNHSPLADFDDAVLADGAGLLAELAARRLAL